MTPLYVILGLVAAQRLAELVYAARNTRQLRARGAIEVDSGGYPGLVLLHAGWLGSMLMFLPAATVPNWGLIGVFAVLQLGRLWVMRTLGARWTTRIIVLPGTAGITGGPYRYCRHPNYLIVACEIAVLPLAFHAPALAAGFSLANFGLLWRRIRLEDRALLTAAPQQSHHIREDQPLAQRH